MINGDIKFLFSDHPLMVVAQDKNILCRTQDSNTHDRTKEKITEDRLFGRNIKQIQCTISCINTFILFETS